MSNAAYYLPADSHEGADWKVLESTPATGSGWGPNLQHGGPPSALLTHEMEKIAPEGGRFGRVVVDIVGAIPIEPLHARAWIERPGKRVRILAAELYVSGRVVARATAWHMRTAELAEGASAMPPVLTPPDACPVRNDIPFGGGFLESVEIRGTSGEPMWMRSHTALIAGESFSPTAYAMLIADTANGVGSPLGFDEWRFMNTDLAVHFVRRPAGEWIGVDGRGWIGPDGLGVTRGTLHDTQGPFAFTQQALLVEKT